MNSQFTNGKINYLVKWFPQTWISITALLSLIIIFTKDLIFDISAEGLSFFVTIFSIPLYFFVSGIPIYGIILTIKRINQSNEQLSHIENQFKESKKSNIEQTFYKLIDLNNNYIENLAIPGFGQETGKKSFSQFHSHIYHEFHTYDWASSTNPVESFQFVYDRFLKNNNYGGPYLEVYFYNLNNILKHIDKHANDIDISTFSNIVKSQLSKYELLLILYHCISNIIEDFGKLVKEYNILQFVDIDEALTVSQFSSIERLDDI